VGGRKKKKKARGSHSGEKHRQHHPHSNLGVRRCTCSGEGERGRRGETKGLTGRRGGGKKKGKRQRFTSPAVGYGHARKKKKEEISPIGARKKGVFPRIPARGKPFRRRPEKERLCAAAKKRKKKKRENGVMSAEKRVGVGEVAAAGKKQGGKIFCGKGTEIAAGQFSSKRTVKEEKSPQPERRKVPPGCPRLKKIERRKSRGMT